MSKVKQLLGVIVISAVTHSAYASLADIEKLQKLCLGELCLAQPLGSFGPIVRSSDPNRSGPHFDSVPQMDKVPDCKGDNSFATWEEGEGVVWKKRVDFNAFYELGTKDARGETYFRASKIVVRYPDISIEDQRALATKIFSRAGVKPDKYNDFKIGIYEGSLKIHKDSATLEISPLNAGLISSDLRAKQFGCTSKAPNL